MSKTHLPPQTAGAIEPRFRWFALADAWTVKHVEGLASIRAELGKSPALDDRWDQPLVDAYVNAYNATAALDAATRRRYRS